MPGTDANQTGNLVGQTEGDLPRELASPARRALTQAGYVRLEQLTSVSAAELKKLHGMGPKALDQLRHAVASKGLAFSGEK